MTTRIYDPNNVPFDVTEARAADLVLNKGWTRQPTTTVPVEPPATSPAEVDDWRLTALPGEQPDTEGDYEPAVPFEDEAEVVETPRRRRRTKK